MEDIGVDRDAQRDTVAALSRDIAAVRQREEAAEKARKKKGEKKSLSDAKAQVKNSNVR